MKSNEITEKQIQEINRLCHILVVIYGSCGYWSEKLKNMTAVDLALINELATNSDAIVKERKEFIRLLSMIIKRMD